MIIDETTTDADLLAAWTAAGDPEALAIVAHRYAPMVLGVCRRHCKTATDADDAFQVTFMILARSASSIRSPSALPGWLHGTAYRVATRTRRRPGTIDDVRIEDIPDPHEPLDQISRCHELQLLDEELARMPEPLRAALVMHYLEGLRISQVAERLEITLGAIRGRLQRGRRELRQRLILRGVTLGGALAALEILPDHTAAAAELADAFLISATVDASASSFTRPDGIANLQSLLSSSTSSSASLLMKTSLVFIASLVATLLLPWGQGEAQPPGGDAARRSNNDGSVFRLAGVPAPPAGAAFQAPVPTVEPAVPEKSAAKGPAGQPKPAADNPFGNNFGPAPSAQNPRSGSFIGNPSDNPFGNSGGDPFENLGGEPFGNSGDDPFATNPNSGPSTRKPASDPFSKNASGGSPRQRAGGPPPGGLFRAPQPQAAQKVSGGTASDRTSAITQRLEKQMQEPLKNQIGTVPMNEFVAELSKAIEAPVFFQPHPELTEVNEETSISLENSGLPLGAELKKTLRPHALRAVVHDEALLIIPDTAELARRGIGTDRYISIDESYMQELEEKFAEPFSQNFNQIPLEDAMRIMSVETGVRFEIDTRALEDLGQTRDLPITIDLSDVTLYDFLQRMLHEPDLTLMPRNGYVMVTTANEAENPSNQISRIYWLDGTGLSIDAASETIETTINPDTWEALGGPSSTAGMQANEHGRMGLVVLTNYLAHREIESLLNAVRQGIVDPRAAFVDPPPTPIFQAPMPGMPGMGMPGMGMGMGMAPGGMAPRATASGGNKEAK